MWTKWINRWKKNKFKKTFFYIKICTIKRVVCKGPKATFHRLLLDQTEDLTHNKQPRRIGQKAVLYGELAGRDLAFPDTVVVGQSDVPYQQGAVVIALTRPFVLALLHAHQPMVLLPNALPSLVVHHARQLHTVTGRYFLIVRRHFDKMLSTDDDACRIRDNQKYRKIDREISRHFCVIVSADSWSIQLIIIFIFVRDWRKDLSERAFSTCGLKFCGLIYIDFRKRSDSEI